MFFFFVPLGHASSSKNLSPLVGLYTVVVVRARVCVCLFDHHPPPHHSVRRASSISFFSFSSSSPVVGCFGSGSARPLGAVEHTHNPLATTTVWIQHLTTSSVIK